MRIPYSHTALGLIVILVGSALSIAQSWSAASRFSATFSSPETEASRIVEGSKVRSHIRSPSWASMKSTTRT